MRSLVSLGISLSCHPENALLRADPKLQSMPKLSDAILGDGEGHSFGPAALLLLCSFEISNLQDLIIQEWKSAQGLCHALGRGMKSIYNGEPVCGMKAGTAFRERSA